jgi:hypothetical protein
VSGGETELGEFGEQGVRARNPLDTAPWQRSGP